MARGLEMDTLRPSFKAEVKDVIRLALPIMATTWSYEATWCTSQLFAGHIGIDELAAAAIGITVGSAALADTDLPAARQSAAAALPQPLHPTLGLWNGHCAVHLQGFLLGAVL
jgi:hypothetical protein